MKKYINRSFFIIGILCILFSIFKISHAQIGGGNPSGSAARLGPFGVQIFTGGTTAVFSQVAATAFTPVNGQSIATLVAATEGDAAQVVTSNLVCRRLQCLTTNIAGVATNAGGTAWTIAVNDNMTATALTCAITTSISTCSDNTHSFVVTAGDLLDFAWTPSGTPTAIVPHCSMECYQTS